MIFKELPDDATPHAPRTHAPAMPFFPSFQWDADELRVTTHGRTRRRGGRGADQSAHSRLMSLALLLSWGFK